MKQKFLKAIYGLNLLVLLIIYFYFFLRCLLYQIIAASAYFDSADISAFQDKFIKLLNFGLDSESAAIIVISFIILIIAMAVFSAIFYIGTTISPVTHILLILSPLAVLIQFALALWPLSYIDVDIFIYLWYLICLIAVIIYAVFITKFMCRDFKTLSFKTNKKTV